MTRPDSARCTATYDHGGNGLGTARCGLPANGHDRHRARTVYGEVEWNEPEPQPSPDPPRYPAGTRVLVEAKMSNNGEPDIEIETAEGIWLSRYERGALRVHGTVAKHEQLQAARDAMDDWAAKAVDVTSERWLRQYDALRTERDNLAANAARLRQKYTLATAALDENRGAARELEALRAEVTRIADALERFPLTGGRGATELRAALATQAPQPAVVAATPPDGAGADDAPHQPAGGSVGHEGLQV